MPLESAGATLHQAGAQAHKDFTGTVYVATPQLLGAFGITAGQIAPGTEALTLSLIHIFQRLRPRLRPVCADKRPGSALNPTPSREWLADERSGARAVAVGG